MDRLSAEDRLMLWGDATWPQDIGALALLDGSELLEGGGRLRIEAVRKAIEAKLHLVPRFRQLLRGPGPRMGAPVWVDAPRFDLAEQVQVVPLAAPADEAQLLLAAERLRRRRLDPSRPLWEMWLFTGLPEERIALYMRMHHVIADGVAGMATLAALLDPFPDTVVAAPPPWEPAPWPTPADLAADERRRRAERRDRTLAIMSRPGAALRKVREAWPALGEVFSEEPGDLTSLDRPAGLDRTLRPIRSSLDLFKGIAHANGAKVNDVFLAAAAGGVRELLRSRGEPVEGRSVRIYVPVSQHRFGTQDEGNMVGQMIVPLPIGGSDPIRRLRQIAAETAQRKARTRPSVGVFINLKVLRRAILKFVERQRVNLLSANVPGPPTPLYLAGARVLEVFPVIPLMGRAALGVGALSYSGQFNVMAIADRIAYPDIEVFMDGFRSELDLLAASVLAPSGVVGQSSVSAAMTQSWLRIASPDQQAISRETVPRLLSSSFDGKSGLH